MAYALCRLQMMPEQLSIVFIMFSWCSFKLRGTHMQFAYFQQQDLLDCIGVGVASATKAVRHCLAWCDLNYFEQTVQTVCRYSVKLIPGISHSPIFDNGTTANFTIDVCYPKISNKKNNQPWGLQVQKSRNKQVQMIFDKGFGIHHVGVLKNHTSSTEGLWSCWGGLSRL